MLKKLGELTLKTLNFIKEKRSFCTVIEQNALKQKETDTIVVERDQNITLIALNRPHKRNSIDFKTAQQLTKAISDFEEDATSPIAVLYGMGGSFCAGHDIAELEEQMEHKRFDFIMKSEGAIGPTRRFLHKPVVCAINGYCVASGLELALMCDFRVMEDTAVLGFYNRRMGKLLTDGGTARLAQIVGVSNALDLISTGRRVTADEALGMGLINRKVATGTALGQSVHLAFSFAKYPMESLLHDRKQVWENTYNVARFEEATRNETVMTTKVMQEMQECVGRFVNSKPADERKHTSNFKERAISEWEKKEIEFEKLYEAEHKAT